MSSPPVDTKINVTQNATVSHPYFKSRAQTPLQILDKSLKLLFPAQFTNILMSEQLIDINTANKWILEYRKFLVMAYLTDNMISPSEQVDQVWHLHMTYTQHYRATCKTLVEHDFKHSPSEGGQSEGQKFENIYGDTLSFYKSVFTIDAPVDVWESTQQRFDMKNFSFRTVNLYRLAVLYSMKVANPNFLVPTAPPPKPAIQNPKELPIIEKKVILRKNIREKNQQTNVNYGWRNNYRHSNTVYVNNSYERNH